MLEQTLLADDHEDLARRLEALVEAYVTGDVSRSAILLLAAEEWRQAGQPPTPSTVSSGRWTTGAR
ncbi:hypothetical protein ACFQX6_38710 [Streptosporangium lutulentum]